ncbi:MAG: NAD(P)H-quinone oxidoreductase subunit N [Synechococcaceae cyanobacterium RM1_1_27]|nr:NAD(P)H-quinone oxidoreductase subunit N [Synechococcaceae cyanobacterium SM2_3_2]NJO85981.1 NAD(P)H-quinone oxidoreductase subunit N [Synechococcaceae cyanobacterium RM1_1_27]
MLLIGSGQGFVKELEKLGSLGICVPAEGGPESHYIRRLRGAGYGVVHMSAKGLGDISASLNRIHGVRPPHLGKSERRTYYFPGLVEQYQDALPGSKKGLVFWFYEGHVLTQQELRTLHAISQQDPRVKIVVEVSRARAVKWQPLV